MTQKAHFLTKAEVADKLGVSRPYVTKLITTGRLHPNEDGLIDMKEIASILQGKKARSQRENIETKMLALQLKEKQNSLVSREKVQEDWNRESKRVRERLLSIPSQISAQITAEKDPFKVEQILTKEFTDVLTELSN